MMVNWKLFHSFTDIYEQHILLTLVALTLVVLYCGRVPTANAPGCTAAEGLLYKPWSLIVATCTARCLHQRKWKEELLGREMADEFCLEMPDIHVTFRDLLHTVNLRHGTNGFTSLPKEGVLRIFSAAAGFEPANLGTKGQHDTSRPPVPLVWHYKEWDTSIVVVKTWLVSQWNYYALVTIKYRLLTSLLRCATWLLTPDLYHSVSSDDTLL